MVKLHQVVDLKVYHGNKKDIHIPSGVTEIGENAPIFLNTTRGMTIRLPKSIRIIRENAFKDCKADIRLTKNISQIRENAFRNCRGYITFEELEHLSQIEKYAFAGCTNLRYLPNFLDRTIVSPGAFMDCINLENVPKNMKKVVSLVFKGCTSIKELPDLKEVGPRAFEGCTGLTSIPTSLEAIAKEAFLNCTNLKEITIGLNLKIIEKDAFKGCPIEKINVPIEIKRLSTHLYNCSDAKYYCVKGLPIKKFVSDINFYKKNDIWINGIDLGNKDDSLVLQNIVWGIPEDKLKTDFWNKLNLTNFRTNLESFRKIGMKDEEISNFIINNSILLGYDIETTIENFNYLIEQKILPSSELKKLFFDTDTLNIEGKSLEEQKDIIINYLNKYYNQNKHLPELFSRLVFEPNDKNRLEIRDNLLYISGMKLLTNITPDKLKKIKLMLNRSEFENIIEVDNENFKKELKDKAEYIEFKGIYASNFNGIKTSFYRKLTGINSKYFDDFIKSMDDISDKSAFNTFMSSLYTIKNWNNLDKKDRAVLLKNEIVGRLLYASIELCYSSDIVLPTDRKGKIILYTDLKTKMKSLDFNEVLKKGSDLTTIFKNDSHVKFMLQIDPYSFDALRYSDDLQSENSCFARKCGYLFDSEETTKQINIIKTIRNNLTGKIKDYYLEEQKGIVHTKEENDNLEEIKKLNSRLGTNLNNLSSIYSYSDNHLFEFLNNKIGIPKLPEKDNKEYLQQIELVMKEYLKDNQDNSLNNFLRLVDFYMRSNSEYILQYNKKDKIESTSKKVFDINTSIASHDRLLYSLYNLNKLAHSINEKHLRIDLIDKRLIDTEEEYSNLTKAIKSINELMDNGINLEDTLKFIGVGEDATNKVQRKVSNRIELGNVNFLHKIIRNGISLIKNKILNYEIVSHFKRIVPEQEEKDIKYKNGDAITKHLQILLELKNKGVLNETNLEKIRILAMQRKLFFETKQIIAEELMKKTLTELNINNFIDMTEDQKYDFYKRNGYIVEVQRQPVRNDKNEIIDYQPILVCYSKTFNESFSVHMVGFSKDIEEKVHEYINSDKYNATISHTILTNPGLTLKEKINLDKIKPEQLIKTPGFAKDGVSNEGLPTLYNYIKYDLHDEIKNKTTITETDITNWFDKRFVLPKNLDMKNYINSLNANTKTTKKSIPIPEPIIKVLKKLHINFGVLPPSKTTHTRKK